MIGALKLKTTLDKETTPSYSIDIIATDDGTNPSANQASITLGTCCSIGSTHSTHNISI